MLLRNTKEKDHKALFEEFSALPDETDEQTQDKITHRFLWVNGLAINDSHPDCLLNVLEYWEEKANGKIQRWVWVTDIPLGKKNGIRLKNKGLQSPEVKMHRHLMFLHTCCL